MPDPRVDVLIFERRTGLIYDIPVRNLARTMGFQNAEAWLSANWATLPVQQGVAMLPTGQYQVGDHLPADVEDEA